MRLLFGTSGYGYKAWKGRFYPEKCKDADMLPYYAERFPAVEINNSFYRIPQRAMLNAWAAQTPAEFRFAMKAPRRITHIQKLKDADDSVSFLFTEAGSLGDKLGPVLFQLPPSMKKDSGLLGAFLARVPRERRVAFEFRNNTWFTEDVFDALQAHGAALCVAETDEGNADAPLVVTAPWGYLRLRRLTYTEGDLRRWAEAIRAQPWMEAYVFFKHEDEALGPQFARQFSDIWRAA